MEKINYDFFPLMNYYLQLFRRFWCFYFIIIFIAIILSFLLVHTSCTIWAHCGGSRCAHDTFQPQAPLAPLEFPPFPLLPFPLLQSSPFYFHAFFFSIFFLGVRKYALIVRVQLPLLNTVYVSFILAVCVTVFCCQSGSCCCVVLLCFKEGAMLSMGYTQFPKMFGHGCI